METPVQHDFDLYQSFIFFFFPLFWGQLGVPEESHTHPIWGGGEMICKVQLVLCSLFGHLASISLGFPTCVPAMRAAALIVSPSG